jgi:hypothetical protein
MIYRGGDHFPLAVLRGDAHNHPDPRAAPPVPAVFSAEDDEEDDEGATGISGLHATDDEALEDNELSGPARVPPMLIEKLLEIRSELRREKRWVLADKVRDALKEQGILVEDTVEGSRWLYQSADEAPSAG